VFRSYLRPIKKIKVCMGRKGREKPCNREGGERGRVKGNPRIKFN
jgi:hypothetical protein